MPRPNFSFCSSPRGSSTFSLLLILCLAYFPTQVHSQARGEPVFNDPEGERREQTFKVLEFEYGTVNQRFDGIMRYYCTFRGKWSQERHPNDFPRYPSWSAPVLISHSNGYRMWTGTETATLGVESIAEVRTFLSFSPSFEGLSCLQCPCISLTHSSICLSKSDIFTGRICDHHQQ